MISEETDNICYVRELPQTMHLIRLMLTHPKYARHATQGENKYILKWTKGISKEDAQIAGGVYEKLYSAPEIIREIVLNPRYHLIPVKMAVIKMTTKMVVMRICRD